MELEQLLDSLDLNRYEKEAIVYLSTVDSATAREIHRHTTIPQGRIYSVIASLSEKGFVMTSPGNPKRYSIKDVRQAIKTYLEKKKEALAILDAEASNVSLKPKQFSYDKKSPSVAVFAGREEHIDATIMLRNSAKREICQIAPLFIGTFASRASMIRALERKVKMRIITRRHDKQNSASIDACITHGGEVRVLDSEELLSMMIVDDKEFLIGMQDHKNDEERLTMMSHNTALRKTLAETFERLWKKAKAVKKKRT